MAHVGKGRCQRYPVFPVVKREVHIFEPEIEQAGSGHANTHNGPETAQTEQRNSGHRNQWANHSGQFTAGHEETHPSSFFCPGHPGDHHRRRDMEEGNAYPCKKEEEQQNAIGGRKADQRHGDRRQHGGKDDEVSQTDPVGDQPQYRVCQGRQLHDRGKKTGLGEA